MPLSALFQLEVSSQVILQNVLWLLCNADKTVISVQQYVLPKVVQSADRDASILTSGSAGHEMTPRCL